MSEKNHVYWRSPDICFLKRWKVTVLPESNLSLEWLGWRKAQRNRYNMLLLQTLDGIIQLLTD